MDIKLRVIRTLVMYNAFAKLFIEFPTSTELAMTNGLEKRKFQRLDYSLEVAIEIVTGKEAPEALPPVQVKSRNLSRVGICLETKVLEIHGVNLLSGSPYARENRLLMKIELIPAEAPFYAIGEVRWYDVAHDTIELTYHLGVEFLKIEDMEKKQLARFLKEQETNKGRRKLFGMK